MLVFRVITCFSVREESPKGRSERCRYKPFSVDGKVLDVAVELPDLYRELGDSIVGEFNVFNGFLKHLERERLDWTGGPSCRLSGR
jgi:hypothetical protein